MPISIETINGHQVQVTTDNNGDVISQVNVDPLPTLSARPVIAKVKALIAAPVPLTQNQRDRAQQLTLALLLGLADG